MEMSPSKSKPAIVEAFARLEQQSSKHKPVAKEKPLETVQQLKSVDAKDFFGSQSAWKRDRNVAGTEHKANDKAVSNKVQQTVTSPTKG